MPPAGSSSPHRSRRRGLLVLGLVLVVVLALMGVGGVFALRAASGKYAKAPTQTLSVDLSALGAAAKDATLRHWSARTGSGSEVLRMHGEEGEFLLAVDPGSSITTPQWIAELPEDAGACSLREASLVCGTTVVDAETGDVTASPHADGRADDALRQVFGGSGKKKSADGGTQGDQADQGDEPDQAGPAPSDGAADGSEPSDAGADGSEPSDGGTDSSDGGGASSDPSDGGDDGAQGADGSGDRPSSSGAPAATGQGTRLSEDSSGPYVVAEDGSVTVGEAASGHGAKTGDGVGDLSLDGDAPVWALPVDAPRTLGGVDLPVTEQLWVVSDGTHLAGLSGSDVLWQQDLDEDTAGLTGLGTEDGPRWYALPGVVLVAGPDAIRAVDARSGEDRWQIDAPDDGAIDAWTTDGTHLWIQSDEALSMLDLTEAADDQDSPVPALPDGDDWKADLPKAPSLDELKKSKLEIPGGCANFGLHYQETYVDSDKDPEPAPGEATFKDGTAKATGKDESGYAGVSLRDKATNTVVDGKPVTVVGMDCFGGGSYAYEALAYYDQDLQLVASLDPLDERTPQLQGTIQEQSFDDVAPAGRTLRAQVPQVQLVGDDGCHACEGTTTADVLYQLGDPAKGGKDVTLLDAVYDTPSGPVRPADPTNAQRFVDALAANHNDAAKDLAVTEDAIPVFGDDPGVDDYAAGELPTRKEMFPKDVKVDECELIGPVDDSFDGDYYMGGGRGGHTIPYAAYLLAGASPGDTVCGLTSKDALWSDVQDKDDYAVYLVIQGDEDGNGKVITIGQTFG
jgi:hypothetical protein